MKILIIGKGYMGERIHAAWPESILSDAIITDKESMLAEIRKHEPDVVLNAAGVRGRPNVDWCDEHPLETIRGNTLLPIIIADACAEAGLYLLHMGSGCIYYGPSTHPDLAWREDDFGNPKPTYSRSKYAADLVLSTLPNVGIARIRMPIDRIPSPNNLIDKLASFAKVADVENSVTIVDDMIDTFHQLLEKRAEGIFHVVNPGILKFRDLIALYEELVDPSHQCEWVTDADLNTAGINKKPRSNNFLSFDRLQASGIEMRPVKEALRDTMTKYAEAKKTM